MRRWTATGIAAAMLAMTGCGGESDNDTGDRPAAAEARSALNGADKPNAAEFPEPAAGQSLADFANSFGATGLQVGLATSVFTPGHNRLAFGLLSEDNKFVYAPAAVYVARRESSKEIAGPYTAPADLLITEPPFRSQQAASEEDPFAAVYAAEAVDLEEPGKWLALVVAKVDGSFVAAPTEVRVSRKSPVPERGDTAPRVETDTAAKAGSIEAVDTRRPTDDMHDVSFDDVVGRKPVALLFSTPQLCQSRVCGPVVDIALQLKQKYGDQVEFIHQEVYEDNDVSKGLRKPLAQFGLPTEPWLFTIDRTGKVAARLEGSFGINAFDKAVQAAIAG